MFKWSICLFLAMPAAALAAVPAPPSVASPLAVGTPHVCMNDYPESAIWDGAEGTAQVAFRIGADGKVKDVTIVKSAGHEDLDAATLGCVGRWSYRPAMRDGVAVEVPWRAMVEWKLHGSEADRHPCTRYHAVTPQLLAGIGGLTKISFRIMPDGTTKDAEIVHSSGNGDLDQAAQRCISEKHFNTMRAVIPEAGVQKDVLVDWRKRSGADTIVAPGGNTMSRRLILLLAILPVAALAGAAGRQDIRRRPRPCRTRRSSPARRFAAWTITPESAVQAGIEGETTLAFTVTAQGTVANVKVVNSSGNADLDAASVVCAGTWKYHPAKKKGVPVETTSQARASWNLHEPPFPWPTSWTRPQAIGANHDCSRFWPDAARRDPCRRLDRPRLHGDRRRQREGREGHQAQRRRRSRRCGDLLRADLDLPARDARRRGDRRALA